MRSELCTVFGVPEIDISHNLKYNINKIQILKEIGQYGIGMFFGEENREQAGRYGHPQREGDDRKIFDVTGFVIL